MTENRELFCFQRVRHEFQGVDATESGSSEAAELGSCVSELAGLVSEPKVASNLSRWSRVRLQCRALADVDRSKLTESSNEWRTPVAWRWWKGFAASPATASDVPSPEPDATLEPDMVVEMVQCKKLATYLPESAVGEKRALLGARAFYISPSPQMVLCTDVLRSAQEKSEVLLHELTHAFDNVVLDMHINNCEALACSEIRASEACECVDKAGSAFAYEKCVRSTALSSIRFKFPAEAESCLTTVFSRCFKSDRSKNPLEE